MAEEVEISSKGSDYEVIPMGPVRRLEKRVEDLEKAGTIPQLQMLITQIIELIKNNQEIVNDVIKADNDLRNDLSKMVVKMDDLVATVKSFMELVKEAGTEEVGTSPEAFKSLGEGIKELVQENKKIIESNTAILESIENLNKKIRAGTPISKILSSYPGLKLRRRE